jgi:hypothetical protein
VSSETEDNTLGRGAKAPRYIRELKLRATTILNEDRLDDTREIHAAILAAGAAGALMTSLRAAADPTAEKFWPQWRGPYATGVSKTADPPVEWSETKNIRWKVEVPGRGSSSPVV